MVREERNKKGYTAKHVAEYLGIKVETYNLKERNNKFTIKQMRDLKELFGLDSMDILLR